MDRSLCLLLGLQLRGRMRRLGRILLSVRGGLLVVFGIGMLILMLWPSFSRELPTADYLSEVRRFGPYWLAVACLYFLIFATGERALSFSPAEVNWLFPAPLHRRQLLLYRLASTGGGILITALIFTLVTRPYQASPVAGFFGLLLILFFFQLFSMVIALITCMLGEQSRRRRIVLLVLFGVAILFVFQVGLERLRGGWQAVLDEMDASPVIQVLIAPLRWLTEAFAVERLWPDFAIAAGLGLAVNAVLLIAVLLLDAQYLEIAATASERTYARLERVRKGGVAAISAPPQRAWFGLSALPYWGGVGPLAWRQLLTALRSPRALVSLILFTVIILMPSLVTGSTPDDERVTGIAGGMLLIMTLAAPQMLPFDFRGDLDRIALLKTLPLPAWRLALGQIVTPVLLLTLVQWLAAAGILIWRQRIDAIPLVAAAFAVPLNLLMVALENLLFLWYPMRQVSTTPGDIQFFGRQMLQMAAKMLSLMLAALPAALFGWLIFFLTKSWFVAGVAAWLMLLGPFVGLVPLLAVAFERFDVSRDTPA